MSIGAMAELRVAILGNFAPRRCGIATFTEDLYRAMAALPDVSPFVVAMNDEPGATTPAYPDDVAWTIRDTERLSYTTSGLRLNRAADVLLIQHEFGIFGGEAGHYLLDLLRAATLPVVTTLHTVLTDPSPAQAVVMRALVARSDALIVMAERGRTILMQTYGVAPHRIAVIPHGIPDRALVDAAAMRRGLGWPEVPTVLSFGLLSPGKGLESMIDALPRLAAKIPDIRYIVLGATHPHLLRDGGETYRESLRERARRNGVIDNVHFENRFVGLDELCNRLQASDVYVTPYLSEAQITSGTLAYAHGLGVPVVSTRYWHAVELLGHRPEQLVSSGSADAIADAVGALLGDAELRRAASYDAYTRGRGHVWSRVARQYVRRLHDAARTPIPVFALPKPAAGHGLLPAAQSNAA